MCSSYSVALISRLMILRFFKLGYFLYIFADRSVLLFHSAGVGGLRRRGAPLYNIVETVAAPEIAAVIAVLRKYAAGDIAAKPALTHNIYLFAGRYFADPLP